MVAAGEKIRHGRIGVGVIYHHMVTEAPAFDLPPHRPVRDCESIEQRLMCEGWNAALDALRAALEAPQQAEPVAWIACSERMPKSGVTVLAAYVNSHGRSRRIRAKWLADRTHEGSPETDDLELVYDETTDMCYWPEGWYEQMDNWPEYSAVAVVEGEPTHWMPLPAGPSVYGSVVEGDSPIRASAS
jgi:hypothetical protein